MKELDYDHPLVRSYPRWVVDAAWDQLYNNRMLDLDVHSPRMILLMNTFVKHMPPMVIDDAPGPEALAAMEKRLAEDPPPDYKQVVHNIHRAFKRGANRIHMGSLAAKALGIEEKS